MSYPLFDESAPDSSGAVSYGAMSGDGVAGSIAGGRAVPGPICCLTLGRSGLFYSDFPVLPYYHIVCFVDGDGTVVSEDRQHS